MYRSQLLLQQLGIAQWIPRAEATVSQPDVLLWRDQSDVVSLSPAPQLHSEVLFAERPSLQAFKTEPVPVITQPEQHVTEVVSAPVIEDILDYPQTISFERHLMLHEKFILVAQIEKEAEQRLFNQIAKACYADVSFVHWPLAIDLWQMNDYVLQSYLQGVFAQHQDKVLISLGELPFILEKDIFAAQKTFSTLQQLLESTQQKRALWEVLFPLVYDVESNNA